MSFVVPFDGSELARSALARAVAFSAVFDEPVLAVTVIPRNNADYAVERGWLDSDDPYDLEAIVDTLREQVAETAPEASFQYELVDRYAPVGTIKNRIRERIRGADASMVFVGSENAGRMVTALSSVGGGIASGDDYDVVIVRHASPPKVDALLEEPSDGEEK